MTVRAFARGWVGVHPEREFFGVVSAVDYHKSFEFIRVVCRVPVVLRGLDAAGILLVDDLVDEHLHCFHGCRGQHTLEFSVSCGCDERQNPVR